MTTKADIVAEVAHRTELKKSEVKQALEVFLDIISRALRDGQRVELRGFGTFRVVKRKERRVNDLIKGGMLTIPSQTTPQFIPYRKLRDKVDKSHQVDKLQESIEEHYRRGVEYTKQGKLDQALEEYNQVLALDPHHVKARSNLGLIYDRKGNYKRAIQEYKKALEVDPENVQVHFNLGAAYWGWGMYNQAEEEFERALELDPENAEAHYNLGVTYYKKGLYDQAVDEMKKALQLNPSHYQSCYYLAGAYNQKGMFDEAIAVYETLLNFNPNDGEAYWYLGVLYDRKGMREKARFMFKKAYGLLRGEPERGIVARII